MSADASFETADGGEGRYHSLQAVEDAGHCTLSRLPFTIRLLLEAALRKRDGLLVTDEDVQQIVETTAQRVVRLLQRRGLLEEGNVDPRWEAEPLLA